MIYRNAAAPDGLRARFTEVAGELRRKGFSGKALEAELIRRINGTKARMVVTKALPPDDPVQRFWVEYQNGGRERWLAECARHGV